MAILPLSSAFRARLVALRQGLLLAMLAVLYLVLWQGPETPLGKTLFVVHLGLFMLWQPFVQTGQRMSAISVLGLAGIVLAGVVFLKGWILLVWIMMLAGLVGGKVLLFGARAPRIFYLLALGFLVVALFLLAAPALLPIAKPPLQILRIGYVGLPLVLVVMAFLPQQREDDRLREMVDFVYSLLIFLLLAVLMLGSFAGMMLFGSGYVEALLQAMLLMGVTLLALGLAWDPQSGFSGLGGLFSRYLMSIGLPIEQWLQGLASLAQREEVPRAFLEQACAEMAQRLRWVRGGEWIAGNQNGRFGLTDGRRWEFRHEGLVLVLYTLQELSPTMIWHCNLLVQLLAQFHADKRRAMALKQLSYMQAVHETGARLTHDVKNLLQSLNALCSAGLEPGAAASLEYQSLLRRQLPAISGRLAETLGKLNAPQSADSARRIPVAEWWQDLRQRMAALEWADFKAELPLVGELPAEVFSGVADNLVRNAAEKRLREPALRLQFELARHDGSAELIVCDTGSAIPEATACGLFAGPVSSETGFGIGLYNAARYAEAAGYKLALVSNRAGRVCFRLARGAIPAKKDS